MAEPGPAPRDLARQIIDQCLQADFAAAGVCEASPSRYTRELREWLAAGKQGTMDYLARNIELRADPATLLPGARSIVMVADLYHARESRQQERTNDHAPPLAPIGQGRIARYAQGRDYHTIIKKRLHALCDALAARFPAAAFRAFVDTAPVLEREYAHRTGLGWQGKHTLLIHPRLGSYMLLGGILTTLELHPPEDQPTVTDHCGTCTRCIEACPTDAITPYSVDASRCISYLTIERREPIPAEFHSPMGDWLYGCDICQEVCPHNSPRSQAASVQPDIHPAYKPQRARFDPLAVLDWTAEDRSREFTGAALKRATLAMMKRNALIVIGNTLEALTRGSSADRTSILERLRRASQDLQEPEMVRLTARQVLDRLDLSRDLSSEPE